MQRIISQLTVMLNQLLNTQFICFRFYLTLFRFYIFFDRLLHDQAFLFILLDNIRVADQHFIAILKILLTILICFIQCLLFTLQLLVLDLGSHCSHEVHQTFVLVHQPSYFAINSLAFNKTYVFVVVHMSHNFCVLGFSLNYFRKHIRKLCNRTYLSCFDYSLEIN